MNLKGKRVVLTGASGGIGRPLAKELVKQGAWVVLVGRKIEALKLLEKNLRESGFEVQHGIFSIAADVTHAGDREHIVEFSHGAIGGVDILINLAGSMSFTAFQSEPSEVTQELFQTNVLAPMELTRLLLPEMVERGSGEIVNVGSIFGSIGFAWFTTYSSTKFALRGFSEALRRELADTGVGVSYFAPRAVRTPFNSDRMVAMCKATNTEMDEPEGVATEIIDALRRGHRERYLGFPEKLFVRINSLLPRLVDRALNKQNSIANRYL